jgi:hypothetical protein
VTRTPSLRLGVSLSLTADCGFTLRRAASPDSESAESVIICSTGDVVTTSSRDSESESDESQALPVVEKVESREGLLAANQDGWPGQASDRESTSSVARARHGEPTPSYFQPLPPSPAPGPACVRLLPMRAFFRADGAGSDPSEIIGCTHLSTMARSQSPAAGSSSSCARA